MKYYNNSKKYSKTKKNDWTLYYLFGILIWSSIIVVVLI